MGAEGGVRPSFYDEYVLDGPLVWLWCDVLDIGQKLSKVDGEE